jgi:hypothetical protein
MLTDRLPRRQAEEAVIASILVDEAIYRVSPILQPTISFAKNAWA